MKEGRKEGKKFTKIVEKNVFFAVSLFFFDSLRPLFVFCLLKNVKQQQQQEQQEQQEQQPNFLDVEFAPPSLFEEEEEDTHRP